MTSLNDFDRKYLLLKRQFDQAVANLAQKITLDETLSQIDEDTNRNPRNPRLECIPELEQFKEGDTIELGSLYPSPHNDPTFTLQLKPQIIELYHTRSKMHLNTFTDSKIPDLYAHWLKIINRAIQEIPPPTF
jgi:hypothetical protein